MPGGRESRSVRVVDGELDGLWEFQWIDPRYEDDFVLHLHTPDGREWTGRGWNMFAALTDLRGELDLSGIKLCCQGARTKVAISRLVGDMGRGMVSTGLSMVGRLRGGILSMSLTQRRLMRLGRPLSRRRIEIVGWPVQYRSGGPGTF